MKIRVTQKDLIIFIIFCVFLLYLCAVAVGNLKSLGEDRILVGLSPMPGFSQENIKLTLLAFVLSLAGLIASVSSFIFNKEKGKLGFSIGEKEDKGYSRWAKPNEIKKYSKVEKVLVSSKDAEAAGVPLMNDGKIMYVDNGENHTLVIGATASGKTTAVVDPLVNSLAKKGESMIITDPKGEIYKNHANYLKDRGYNVLVLNFRDPVLGSAWNPLSLPYLLYKAGNHDKSTELLEDVALNILTDPNNKNDPFWEKSASDYFSGLCLGLFEDAEENQVNINTVSYISTVGEEKLGTSTYVKEYFQLKGEDSTAYTFASNTINAPTETKGGILSVFRQKIRTFASRDDLSEMLSYTSFDMRNIGNEKTAIFMVIHDEKTTYHALATIFIKQCYETLIDVAYKQPNGRLPYRTNFILDEFANMPALKDVTSMVTAARSRDIRFTFIIQNFAQLTKVYGKDDAETIKSNCGNLIYLLTTELAALEEISKLCGDVKAKGKDAEKAVSVPLVTVSDLQRLKMNEVIIIKTRLSPFKTKLTPSYKIEWGHKFDKGDFIQRPKEPIQLFDIKEYVKEHKKNKLLQSMNNNQGPNEEHEKMMSTFGGGTNNYDSQMPSFNPSAQSNNPFGAAFGGGSSQSLDDVIKQIDAQIAKLEAEEKAKNDSAPAFIDNRDKVETPANLELPKIEVPETKVIVEAPIIDIPKQPEVAEIKESDIEVSISETIKEEQPILEQEVIIAPNIEEKPKVAIADDSVVFTVQEPVIQETLIPTVEDIKQIHDEVKQVPIESVKPEELEKPIVNVDVNEVEQKNNYITDDQFFDDFFGDE